MPAGKKKVQAICKDGQVFEGDMLIGADGIWSKVGWQGQAVALAQQALCCRAPACPAAGSCC